MVKDQNFKNPGSGIVILIVPSVLLVNQCYVTFNLAAHSIQDVFRPVFVNTTKMAITATLTPLRLK